MSFPSPQTTAAIERLLAALDYPALGPIYCDHGGDAFWEAHRGPVLDLGLAWAKEVATRLPPGGRSLYVGAGVAELPVLLTECLDLGRTCIATNLRSAECDSLNASLRAADLGERLQLQCGSADRVATEAAPDHLALVNVLDDPETFPSVSAVTYGRASPLDLDVDGFARERDEVRALVAVLGDALQLPAWITTTVEEAPWFLEWAAKRGVAVQADETMIETALVGDGIGFLRLGAER